MKKQMKKWTEKCTATLLIASLLLGILMPTGSVCAAGAEKTKVEDIRQGAVRFLQKQQNPDGSYGDDGLIVETCLVETVLRECSSEGGLEWTGRPPVDEVKDNDSLARLYSATGETDYLDKIPSANRDGGYGLTRQYRSDSLDTVLVLEAFLRSSLQDGRDAERLQAAVSYFREIQNPDGGFSYLPGGESDYRLTIKIADTVVACVRYGEASMDESFFFRIDDYLAQNPRKLENAEEFCDAAYAGIYQCLRGTLSSTSNLLERLDGIQNKDGGFGSLEDTVAALRLLWAVEEAGKPWVTFKGMETTLSAYTLYAGYATPITVTTCLDYACNYPYDLTWQAELLINGETGEVLTKELVLAAEETQTVCTSTMKIEADEGDDCRLRTSILQEGRILFEQTDELHVVQLTIDELELTAEELPGEGTALSWNSISNDFCRYRYRLYRSTDGEEWETKSSWDGTETVKVLNIYPNPRSEGYLRTWMNSNLSGEPVSAGRGLFEIDTVYIDIYNQNPEKYLVDEKGEYKYDVLFFGAADSNANKDLNEKSYQATREFTDSGRGVLFGHDTVTIGGVYHGYFARFTDSLGIKLKADSGYQLCNTVRVVNSGVLTSYPWKVEGVLQIPTTHTYRQYSGGSLPATVWMEFTNGGYVDEETGGRTNAYLCSRNQFALIQTGHSNGLATDDERKVLANTLFYLKQMTEDTSLVDRTARDKTAPGACRVSELSNGREQLTFCVEAEDYGTAYSYYVEGIPQMAGGEELRRLSNTVEVEILSGIAGYETVINACEESEETGENSLSSAWDWNLSVPDSNQVVLSTTDIPQGKGTLYLHVRAVDAHGNRGEETILPLPENRRPACFETGYGLFSMQDASVYCGSFHAGIPIYVGGSLTLGGSVIRVDAPCNAGGSIYAYTGYTYMASCAEHAGTRELPQLLPSVTELVASGRQETMLNLYNSTRLREAVYAGNGAAIYCPEIRLDASLVCDGDINLGVDSARLGDGEEIAVCSAQGNITINASRCTGKGLIYAPNGTVTINVQNLKFEGSIIARQIRLQGTELVISAPAR